MFVAQLVLATVACLLVPAMSLAFRRPFKSAVANKLRRFGSHLIISSSLIVGQGTVVFADDVVSGSSPILMTSPAPVASAARPVGVRTVSVSPDKPLAMSERTSLSKSENEQSYEFSLRKERAKQESLKKTKQQRAQDLCERLGRGC